jgi:hypothetical protein
VVTVSKSDTLIARRPGVVGLYLRIPMAVRPWRLEAAVFEAGGAVG